MPEMTHRGCKRTNFAAPNVALSVDAVDTPKAKSSQIESPRRKLFLPSAIMTSVLLSGLVLAIQTGTQPTLAFNTDVVSGLPAEVLRALYFSFGGSLLEKTVEMPTKRAKQLILIASNYSSNTRMLADKYPSFDSCLAVQDHKSPKRVATNIMDAPGVGSTEWREWSKTHGTQNAPFYAKWIPERQEEQEFPIFHSGTPCGIHEVSSTSVGEYEQVVEAGSGAGTAIVMQLENEANLGHTLRAGVAVCTHLLARRLREEDPLESLTLVVFWPKKEEENLGSVLKDFKLQMLGAIGKVHYVHPGNPGSKTRPMKFARVFKAPWNGMPENSHDYSLAQGPIQLFFGEASLRLSMSSVIVNRKPLRMYMGFSAAIRKGLGVRTRPADSGAVVVMQRAIYYEGDNMDHKRHQQAKQRLLVDSASGTSEGLLQGLCRLGLPIRVLDFHPDAEAPLNTLKEQVRIIASTAVLAGSHGSGLWNALWMRPGSVAIEVTLRTGHCCHPIPKQYWNSSKPCTSPCHPYTMINIADGIMASGVRWFYYDPLYIDQPTGDSVRDTRRVHVDKDEFTRVIAGAYALATNQFPVSRLRNLAGGM
uniref:Glycosyltransferase 61 catalytic domain-containing protein n=1 Tax=Lotharella globosa TaxID=91324 RepID=A0A7S4DXZ9_9EUKA|mmetsp:Transcript_22710/g.45664  ORF Transcript_22710/g.45664 Transcript_22710/m.45664 type:complete len:590 (+) Transcript_22710:74-1843(+)|eukprot:CAMPEP_0167775084 /NCGR_PEP_ID=MMETSP0111_2-20121227/2359_1 /TAXON_ID=91324 /ORGANISM="Lotharella globosa, Strain CCCM811" /LENGTH=589 /DNA_ID=CAMNT_0007664953 /DNA_START=73 /DNA_END=1842 /DNA_ORIENTATION=+